MDRYNTFKHKITSVIIATAAAYFGFQALDLSLGLYQIPTYFSLAWFVFAFHIFWLAFLFDLHYKSSGKGLGFWKALDNRVRHFYHWAYVRRYLNYLLLPTVIYWSVIVLMYLNPFHELFKDGLIIITTAALGVAYWYLKEAFSRHMELHHTGLKVLAIVKLYGAFLAFTALMALGWYYGLGTVAITLSAMFVAFILCYQALFQHRLMDVKAIPLMLVMSLLVGTCFAIVYKHWNVNYYTAGLMVVVVYNAGWGMIHRYKDKTLTNQLLVEYVFMLVVLVSVVLATQDFNGKI